MPESSVIQPKKPKESPFSPKGADGSVYVLLHDVTCILAAITVLFIFFARLVGVSGSSMNNTLIGGRASEQEMGDYLLLESNFLSTDYQRGDIVVACVPSFENGKPIVKRVIGLPGQTIEFRKENETVSVWVDGVRLEEPYIREAMREGGLTTVGFTAKVPEGCYFLMGDNRNNSRDSRDPMIGMVDGRYLVGKARWLVWPGRDAAGKRDWSRFGDVYND